MRSKTRNVVVLDEVQADCAKLLRADGFRRRGRSFNRPHNDGLVGVVTFFAMPSYSCLRGAFNVELGIVLPCIGNIEHPGRARSKSWYLTANCKLRTDLPRLAKLPKDYLWDLSRSPVEMADEISNLFSLFGLPFLDEFTTYEAVVARYEADGCLPGSHPHRSALDAAMIYYHLGDRDSARKCFAEALSTDHTGFRGHVESIRDRCVGESA